MKREFLASAIAAALVGVVTPASAELDEIVVTAQKREQNLQDVPISITAMGGELLENNEVNSIEDLAEMVPSLKFTAGDNPNNNSVRMRGVGTSVFSSAVEPNVSVVVDGVVLARSSMVNFDFVDIERVEVLRGPQGTLFGKNASAGLVHVITQNPAEEFEAKIKVSYDQPQDLPGYQAKLQAAATGPIVDGLRFGISGFYKDQGGYYTDVERDTDIGDATNGGLRVKLGFDLTDNLSGRLQAEHQIGDSEAGFIVFRNFGPRNANQNDKVVASEENYDTRTYGDSFSETELTVASLSLDWDVGEYTLTSLTSFAMFDSNSNLNGPAEGDNVKLLLNGGDRLIETWAQELRLTSPGGRALEYTTGVYAFYNQLDNDFDRHFEDVPVTAADDRLDIPELDVLDQLPGGVARLTLIQGFDNKVDTLNLGLFAQGTWHITERLHLTSGLRLIHERLDLTFSSQVEYFDAATGLPLVPLNGTVNVPEAKVDDTDVTGMAALQYDVSEQVMSYVSYARGYRGRAYNIVSSSKAEDFDEAILPEIADSFEVGIKTRLFDNSMTLNVTGFWTFFNDFQAQLAEVSLGGAPELKVANAEQLETKGIEIDFMAKPFEPLMIFGALMYNKAVFNDFVTQCFPGQGADEGGAIDSDGDGTCDAQDVSGKSLGNAPEFSGSVSARLTLPIGQSTTAWYVQATGRWQSAVNFSNDQHPNTKLRPYGILDLRAGVLNLWNSVELALYVDNVFDKVYPAVITTGTLRNDREDTAHYLPRNSNRNFGLALEARF